MNEYITATITLHPDLYVRGTKYASDHKTPFNYLVREALEAYIKESEEDEQNVDSNQVRGQTIEGNPPG